MTAAVGWVVAHRGEIREVGIAAFWGAVATGVCVAVAAFFASV